LADAMQFAEVIAAGPGWTKVRGIDGQVYTLKGNRNWRNNNPGNLEYGNFAKSNDAIGTDGRFAVFPSFNEGLEAMQNLLFGSPKYADLSIEDAISRYAPAFENDTGQYVNVVANAAGVPPSTKLRDLGPEQRARFVQAQVQHEGFKPGRINGTPVPPADIPFANNEVATAVDTRPLPPLPKRRPVTAPTPAAAGQGAYARFAASNPGQLAPYPEIAGDIEAGLYDRMAPRPAGTGRLSFGPPPQPNPLGTAGRADVTSPFTRGSVASMPPSASEFTKYSLPGQMPTVFDLAAIGGTPPPGIARTVPLPPGVRPAGVDALMAQANAAMAGMPTAMSFNPLPAIKPTLAQLQAIRAVPQRQVPPLPRQRPASALPVLRAPTPMPPLNRALAAPVPASAALRPSASSTTSPSVSKTAWDWIMNGAS
jgi:hypothetical protein